MFHISTRTASSRYRANGCSKTGSSSPSTQNPPGGFVPENCEKVYDLWMREYEAMRDFGCCFVLTLHPWLSGRPSRVRLLERIIRDLQADGSAWFATGEEIARHFLDHPDAPARNRSRRAEMTPGGHGAC